MGCGTAVEARQRRDYALLRENIDRYLASVAATLRPDDVVVEVGVGPYGSRLRRYLSARTRYVATDVVRREGCSLWDVMERPPKYVPRADVVLASEVLEHLSDPQRALVNMRAALKCQGRLVLTLPFMFGEHKPTDYWRFTCDGIRALCAGAGLSQVLTTHAWAPWQHTSEPLNIFVEASP